jgi:excisionase family DNA binding protein
MPRKANVEHLMTAKQAADALGIHTNTLARWRNEGTIEGLRLGHAWIYRARDVEKLCAADSRWKRNKQKPN